MSADDEARFLGRLEDSLARESRDGNFLSMKVIGLRESSKPHKILVVAADLLMGPDGYAMGIPETDLFHVPKGSLLVLFRPVPSVDLPKNGGNSSKRRK